MSDDAPVPTDPVLALSGADPDADLADLGAVAARLDGAAVVGLGEATHGTREFFRLRHRLTRVLVERLGFRTVAVEAGAAEAVPAADYVFEGEGDAASALADLRSWFWRTRGARDLLEWLRSFNEGRPAEDRVRLRGVDVGDPADAAAHLRAFVREVDPDYYRSVRALLDPLADAGIAGGSDGRDGLPTGADRRRRAGAAETLAADLRARIECHRSTYADLGSPRAVALAEYLCGALAETCGWLLAGGVEDGIVPEGFERRDRAMAENAARLVEAHGRGVVVWAHNGHVQRGRFDDGRPWSDVETMGERLHRRFGDRYRAVCSDFGRGSFRAVPREDGDGTPRTFALEGPLEGSVPARLAELDPATLYLDVGAAEAKLDHGDRDGHDHPASWVDRPGRFRAIGSVFDPAGDPRERYVETDLVDSVDGLLFVETAGPSEPIDGGTPD